MSLIRPNFVQKGKSDREPDPEHGAIFSCRRIPTFAQEAADLSK